MSEANRHYRVLIVNRSARVETVSGVVVCSCDDPGDAIRICELLEADEQRKEKKQ